MTKQIKADVAILKTRVEVLRHELKTKQNLLKKYIKCFRKSAKGKLTSIEIEQIIKNVINYAYLNQNYL